MEREAADISVQFFLDSSGEDRPHTGIPDPVIKLHFADSDEYSEDEVVFSGRHKFNQHDRPSLIDHSGEQINASGMPQSGQDKCEVPHNPFPPTLSTNISAIPEDIRARQDSSLKRQTLGGKQNETRGNRDAEDDHAENLLYEEIDVLADYIANIDSDYCDLNRAYGSIQSLPTKAYDPKPGGQYPVSGEHDVVAGHGKREIYHPGSSYVRRFEEMSSSSELDGIENPSQEGKGYFISRNNYKPEYSMFASATAFADALDWDTFYDLGIMDVDKPSPRKKWKGKRRSLPPEFSDSELGRELTIAWQNDREKKKAKKKKREDLRSRGQLGRPLGGVDLKAKYSNGMALDDLKEEICLFLQSSKISTFPVTEFAISREREFTIPYPAQDFAYPSVHASYYFPGQPDFYKEPQA
ncbi:hypothetical protein EYZ11_012703 [Aspergillus tanneri]|uniref:Uncharacterized protein n=1 Tax=Aspergillus tanneri TaxID=1220188 RepID=A0A4S3IZI5_9EURO|nr:hypothetical protein EYZ11_012703 [Aspergillus tanneri]